MSGLGRLSCFNAAFGLDLGLILIDWVMIPELLGPDSSIFKA
jgi:hypothetical protein